MVTTQGPALTVTRPAQAFTPSVMIAPTIGMKLARWNVTRRTAAAFPTM